MIGNCNTESGGDLAKVFHLCRRIAVLRRRAAPEFSRGFQPTGRLEKIPASRERRLNPKRRLAPEVDSIVADATWEKFRGRRGLKPTAKLNRRSAAKKRLTRSKIFLICLIALCGVECRA